MRMEMMGGIIGRLSRGSVNVSERTESQMSFKAIARL